MSTQRNCSIKDRQVENPFRVLIVGYRSGLGRALRTAGIPFAIWNDKLLDWPTDCIHGLVGDLSLQKSKLRLTAEKFLAYGPFTHVIAAKESGVFAASVARRVLGARQSKDTVVLRCRDKLLMKRHLQKAGIPMAAFLAAGEVKDAEVVFDKLKTPVVSKERWRSGGRGLQVVSTPAELKNTLGRTRLLEQYVNAPEMSIETFVNDKTILFESSTFYYKKGFVNVVPSGIAESLLREVLELNRRVIKALDIVWGMTHLEVYLTQEGPFFGEIALRPPGGYIMNCLQTAWGFDPWHAFLAVELDMPFEFPLTSIGSAAATILHPGEGEILAIDGWDKVQGLSSTVQAKLKVQPGSHVPARTGVGNDIGYVISRAASHQEMIECLEHLAKNIRVSLKSP